MSTLSFLHSMSRMGTPGASEALTQYRRERKLLREYHTAVDGANSKVTIIQDLPPVMPRPISDADDSSMSWENHE